MEEHFESQEGQQNPVVPPPSTVPPVQNSDGESKQYDQQKYDGGDIPEVDPHDVPTVEKPDRDVSEAQERHEQLQEQQEQ